MKDIQIRKLQEENKAHHEGNIFLSNLLIQERNEKRKIEAEFKAYIAEMEAYCDSLEAKIVELTNGTSIDAKNIVEIEEKDIPPSTETKRKGQFIKLTEDKSGWCPFGSIEMAKGKKGEEKAVTILTEAGYDVYDMSDDPEYRKKDIDFILADEEGNQHTLEVKSSSSAKYGKVWIEDILNIKTGKKGWLHYCEADYMMAVGKGMYYVYDFNEMKDYINQAKDTMDTINERTPLDPFNKEIIDLSDIDQKYVVEKRHQEDPTSKWKGTSLIYGVDMNKYAETGRMCVRKSTKGMFA